VKVLVTGATGFVGSMLVTKLALNPDFEIIALDNCSRYGFDFVHEALQRDATTDRVRLVKADFTDVEAIRPILRELDGGVIIHCGALPDERLCNPDPEKCVKTNILGTYLLTVSEHAKPKTFIFASSQAVYGYPENVPVNEEDKPKPADLYSVTKRSGEELVRIAHFRKNIASVILRISFVYGYGLFARWNEVTGLFVKNALEHGSITLLRPSNISEPGAQVIDFIHVSDVCNGIISSLNFALNHQSCLEVFNIAGGQGLSIAQLATIVKRQIETKLGKSVNLEQAIRNEPETPKMILDIIKAQNILNWRPTVSIEEGVKDLITRYTAISRST
jgi:nucleoside-diphosphate-sugar epimerase